MCCGTYNSRTSRAFGLTAMCALGIIKTKSLGGLVPIPKVFQSDVSIVLRFFIPRAYISKVLYSEGSIVR